MSSASFAKMGFGTGKGPSASGCWACNGPAPIRGCCSGLRGQERQRCRPRNGPGGLISIPLAFIVPMPGIAAAIKVSQEAMPAMLETG